MSLSFLAPQFLWALLAIPIVIILHFIRARKKRYEVSALFLWKQAKELAEQRRRFNPSWLLILQIAFATLAALALSQPSLTMQGPPDRVLIVDASASMAAADSDGVRLAKAVDEAQSLVRGAGRVALIRAGLDATVVEPLTDDLAAVTQSLETLSAIDREADLGRALSLALSTAPEADVHIFTDGEPPSGNRATLHAVGGDALNLGINTFDIGIQQAFVSVVSSHPRPQEITLELFQDDALVGQTLLLVPAEGQANISFPLETSSGFFGARIVTPEWDALELDNTAYAGKRDLRVVLTSREENLERALNAIPNLNYQVLPNANLNAPGFDAVISIGPLPDGVTQGNFLLFARAAEEPDFKTIRSWDRSDPLLRFVDLNEARVGLSPELPFINEEWDVLARTSDLSPVILREEVQNFRLVSVNFNPSQTDLVNRSAFPLFVTNVMNSFRNEERLVLGEPLPSSATLSVGERDVERTVVSEPGLYSLNGQTYAASLLSTAESRLPSYTPAETAPPPDDDTTVAERARNIALTLVAAALIFLLAEWALWSRGRRGWTFRRSPR